MAPAYENVPDAVEQVETSRKYLHLDWPAFIDDRKKLYNKIHFKVKEGMQHAARAEHGNPAARTSLKSIASELADMTKEDQPYSAAATAYLLTHRDVWWVRDVVLRLPSPATAVQPFEEAV